MGPSEVETGEWAEGRVLQVYAGYTVQGDELLGSPIGLSVALFPPEFDPVQFSNLNFPVRAHVFGSLNSNFSEPRKKFLLRLESPVYS